MRLRRASGPGGALVRTTQAALGVCACPVPTLATKLSRVPFADSDRFRGFDGVVQPVTCPVATSITPRRTAGAGTERTAWAAAEPTVWAAAAWAAAERTAWAAAAWAAAARTGWAGMERTAGTCVVQSCVA